MSIDLTREETTERRVILRLNLHQTMNVWERNVIGHIIKEKEHNKII